MLSETEYTNSFDTFNANNIYDVLFNKNPNNVQTDTPIYISEDKSICFGELSKLIRKCAFHLKDKYGIQKGDVVAIRSFAHIDYPIVMHGAMFIGATIAPVDHEPNDTIEVIGEDLKSVKPKLFITDYIGHEISLQAAARAGIPTSHILVLGNNYVESIANVNKTLLVGENMLDTPYAYTQDEAENRPLFLFYTSGSTGKKKVVVCTLKAMLNILRVNFSPRDKKRNVKVLATMQFNYANVIYSDLHLSILHGDEVYIVPSSTNDEMCQAIEKYKITTFINAPHVITRMVKENAVEKYDLSSLKTVISVGGVLPKKMIQSASKMFGVPVLNTYGATEMHTPFTLEPELSTKGAVGHLKPDYTARVVDDDSNEVDIGKPGELLIKGPTLAKGYYNNPVATANAFTKDGYYRTGDVFVRDEDDVFWFKSRSNNLIICDHTHIYPYEIERVVLTHPKVADCGVVGIYSEEYSTEVPRAYVVLVDKADYKNRESLEKEILEYTNKQLHEVMQIKAGVIAKERFSRTRTGKILYRVLKEDATIESVA